MIESERLEQLKEAFRARMTETPRDLFVKKYRDWQGAEPIPQEHYEVVYHNHLDKLLERIINQDQRLHQLREKLIFELDEKEKKFHVRAEHVGDID